MRDRLAPVAARLGARLQVAEVPPGPPVLQTLVAEVYGPDPDRRVAVAREVKALFEGTPGVADVDWYVEDTQQTVNLEVDLDRAAAAGVAPSTSPYSLVSVLWEKRRGCSTTPPPVKTSHRAAATTIRTPVARRAR
jgi:multidrug efflux pump subunit AcrB